MPGTFRRTCGESEMMTPHPKPQPPPVAARPRAPKVTLQTWQTVGDVDLPDADGTTFGHHVRSGSVDSVDSNSGSSLSSSGSHSRQLSGDSGSEFIPTRTVGKTPSLPSRNPLQFVKVQSPLYKKAEQQIKIAKEVKISKDTLKEGEEEWQSNLDNWKSRRRKASEKVFQRVEEMRQIEVEEQNRQQQQQQRKIKTFSEIIEKKAVKKRNYSLDLYMGQGDDSGVGGTPEPDDHDGILDGQSSALVSDASEGMTSECESIDSDARGSDKIVHKEPPKVPKKPYAPFLRSKACSEDSNVNSSNGLLHHRLQNKDIINSDNVSSAEPSDVEGHAGDTETISSEDDAGYCGPSGGNHDSGLESLCDRPGDIADSASDFSQDSCSCVDKINHETDPELASSDELEPSSKKDELSHLNNGNNSDSENISGDKQSIKLTIKQGIDNKGFGFNLKGGKDQGCIAFVDSIIPGSPADIGGLQVGDMMVKINGEATSKSSHSSLVFSIKQAVYTGQLDLVICRSEQSVESAGVSGKPKIPKRGVSFAEKLAMFSASNNGSKVVDVPAKPAKSLSLVKLQKEVAEEPKEESLVLRRRSAFESGASEKDKKRWSFGHNSQQVENSHFDERRRSVDFSENLEEVNSIKKHVPPPIPVKPKLRPKPCPVINNSYVSASEPAQVSCSVDQTSSVNHYFEDKQINEKSSNEEFIENGNSIIDEDKFYSGTLNEQCMLSQSENDTSEVQVPCTALDTSEHFPEFPEAYSVNKTEKEEESLISNSSDLSSYCPSSMGSDENPYVYEGDVEPLESIESNIDTSYDDGVTTVSVNSNVCNIELSNINSQTVDVCEESQDTNNDVNELTCCFSSVTVSDNADIFKTNGLPKNTEFSCENERTLYNEQVSYVSNIQIDSSVSQCDNDTLDNENQHPEDCHLDSEEVESKTEDSIIEPEVSSENRENFVQINVHPMNLMLEKIDEDDGGVSASTTSSDTPDTETIIEHFPANVSPLPNDEVANESSGNDANPVIKRGVIDDGIVASTEDPLYVTEKTVVFDLQQFSTTIEPEPEEEEEDEIHLRIQPGANLDSVSPIQEAFENPEEYDAINQKANHIISPLDVFDQIELKLMQQLEQQGEELEDVNDLNGEYEDEINQELLYLSEDASFFDELDAPRNVQPPSEPPPPPPPPEVDNEQTASPFQRANSTKRIRKELWRRRSDFLGIDSPQGIDIDNMPPPPPGLEELLKSEMEMEREQRLWLEKRLSLAEAECSDSLPDTYSSSYHSSDKFFTNEYSTEYPLEVYDAEVYDAVNMDPQTEEWKTEMEQCQNDGFPEVQDNTENFEDKVVIESPQHKAKSHIQSLGAAPRAKIMDSNKWITQTEKNIPVLRQKTVDPLFRDGSYNQNFWLAQEAGVRNTVEKKPASRRYSMPPACGSVHPDVTIRTWGDREFEQRQQPRPTSVPWQGLSSSVSQPYVSYSHSSYIGNQKSPNDKYDNISEAHPAISHKCSCCGHELSEGSAMGIDTLQLYFHIECFRCCMCHVQLGNGLCGTDVQVKDRRLYCANCFTID